MVDVESYRHIAECSSQIGEVRAALSQAADDLKMLAGKLHETELARDALHAGLKAVEDRLQDWSTRWDEAEKRMAAMVERATSAETRLDKLADVVRNGIEHVETDCGAWGGWLTRARLALQGIPVERQETK